MKQIWEETIKPDGTSSLQTHEVKVVRNECRPEDHRFEIPTGTGDIPCVKCGALTRYILGLHKITNGKISRIL
jgi:hypothetical protein